MGQGSSEVQELRELVEALARRLAACERNVLKVMRMLEARQDAARNGEPAPEVGGRAPGGTQRTARSGRGHTRGPTSGPAARGAGDRGAGKRGGA